MSSAQVMDSAHFSPSPGDSATSRLGALRAVLKTIVPAGCRRRAGRAVPLGIAALDGALGGGLSLGSLHEIAAAREAESAAATFFALVLAARRDAGAVVWIAEDFSLAENGAPYGPGLDLLGLAPERLVTVAAAQPRDVLWALEEALRTRGIAAAIGEIRSTRGIDLTATRRLSLAAGRRQSLALLLRTTPACDASAAATRWVIGAAASQKAGNGPGPPGLRLALIRNRRGPLGSWTVEWNRVERRLDLAPAHRERLAQASVDRPYRAAGA